MVITTLGAIYGFQKAPEYKSTAFIVIGDYESNSFPDELWETKLIESTTSLIQNLNINFIHKLEALGINSDNFVFKPIEDRLIQITYTSPSSVTSDKKVNEILTYILNRHSLLLSNHSQKLEKTLVYKIEKLNNEIKYTKGLILSQNKERMDNEKLIITNEIESLNKQIEYTNENLIFNNELPAIDLKINALNKVILEDQNNLELLESDPDLFLQRITQLPTLNQIIHSYNIQLLNLEAEKVNLLHSKSDEIFKLTQEKDNLETQLKLFKSIDLESDEVLTLSQEKNRLDSELEFLMNQNPTSTQLIGKILGNNISTKKEVIILLSFIFGLFLSIVIVLINNSLKAFKEE